VNLLPALAYEREILFEQFRPLREVDEDMPSSFDWSHFLERIGSSSQGLWDDAGLRYELGKPELTVAVAAGIPGARRYLHEVQGMSIEALDNLSQPQIFFLAVRRYYERARDEMWKAEFLAPW